MDQVAPVSDTLILDPVVETADPDLDPGKHAHIVKVEPGESAAAKVMEARIFGFQVEALCGHRWIPSKDPTKLPICPTCKEIYELYRMSNENLGESPQP